MKLGKKRIYLFWLIIILIWAVLLPNIFNSKERNGFSDKIRLSRALELTVQYKDADSITVIPGPYYRRSSRYTYFFGEKNRSLWTTPVTVKIFNYDSTLGGMTPYEIGGSQQTISIRLKDSIGRSWVLRSVNKDQQNALPRWLRPTILRSMFRDQAAAINPYAPLVVKMLSGAIQLPHLNPQLYWMPYDSSKKQYNNRIAGRLVYLEEHLNKDWQGVSEYNHPLEILDKDDLKDLQDQAVIPVDTLMYLKTRLFDMLISDWDRHEDQWKWLLVNEGGRKKMVPLGRDRDIAFYIFDEGIISKLALQFNNKFQSFRNQYGSIEGLMHQSKKQDKELLSGVPKLIYLQLAKEIQSQLNTSVIEEAFRQYPPAIYNYTGKHHQHILQSRLKALPKAAEKFYELVND